MSNFSPAIFAERLKQLRLESGLSQPKLAEVIDSNMRTIQSWELMTREPKISACYVLADFFNVSLDYLVGRSDEKSYMPSKRESI